jgi:hypothetical protein
MTQLLLFKPITNKKNFSHFTFIRCLAEKVGVEYVMQGITHSFSYIYVFRD